ncbi:MAG: hypothetical protein IJP82_03095 [Bacteroidaceae bacterium]|nr:hypothetical protein [Bacteroidaceae bacterium]
MKKIIFILSVIIGSLMFQSCFCEHDFYGPGYGHYHGYGAPPPPPPHRHYAW